jgi:hypothetical protein
MNRPTLLEQKSFLGLFSLARDDFLRIEWEGLQELEEMFNEMEDNFMRILTEEYTQYGMLVEEGTKALAPHDEGDLEDSINFGQAVPEGSGVSVEGGSNAKHALKRHERPYRMGTHPKYENGAKFPDYYKDGRGEGTRSKRSWRGQMPGRKYLLNAINATERDYEKMLDRILERTLEGDHS